MKELEEEAMGQAGKADAASRCVDGADAAATMSSGVGQVTASAPGRVERESVDDDIEGAIARGEFRSALTLCVQEHGPALGRLCMAMVGTQGEADDLAQESLLTAYESFAAWRSEGSLRAWLFGIARKKCLQHLEKQRRRASKLQLVRGGSGSVDTEDLVLLRQRAARARSALDAVRPSEREALLLRYVAQLSFADVAAACGIEEAAARKRVSRALLKLRKSVEGTE